MKINEVTLDGKSFAVDGKVPEFLKKSHGLSWIGNISHQDCDNLGTHISDILKKDHAELTIGNTVFKITKEFFRVSKFGDCVVQSDDNNKPQEEWEQCEVAK